MLRYKEKNFISSSCYLYNITLTTGLKSNEVTEPSSGLADHQLFVQPEQHSEEELSEEQEDEEKSIEEEQAPINRFRGLYIILNIAANFLYTSFFLLCIPLKENRKVAYKSCIYVSFFEPSPSDDPKALKVYRKSDKSFLS